MSNKYDWQIDAEFETDEGTLQSYETGWPLARAFWFLLGVVVLFAVLFGIWQAGQVRLAKLDAPLNEEVQAVLDLEYKAVQSGDSELFLLLQANNPTWISTQLLPENLDIIRAGLTVTHAEQYENFIWADITWTENGEMRQRTAFFKDWTGRLLHVPTAPTYWNTQRQVEHQWGTLVYHQVDSEWTEEIAAFVSETIAHTCATYCLEDRLPLTLVLAGDYGLTAVPHRLRLPSPRLMALDEDGAPAPLFWQTLQRQIEDYLTPATIRFAVPPTPNQSGLSLSVVNYAEVATRFMAAHPDIIIELVNLNVLPDDLAQLTTDFDGAAVPPTQAMLSAGLVYDLTDFMNTDPDFDQVDFYEQIWQGTRWQERTWWMPQSAAMPLIFYDKTAYRLADRPEPSVRWTWTEMAQDVSHFAADQPDGSSFTWGFIDPGLDTIFSHAYNWNNNCTEEAAVLCQDQLQAQNVAAALDWYSQMVDQPDHMPDLTGLTSAERDNILLQRQGAKRHAVIWIDYPVNYEFRLLLSPLGVVPFPGSDKFDGITPLWVQGSFISRQSKRPLAMWQWLKFLSYQHPAATRLIPARPSVATEMDFWGSLPPELGDAMRVGFPFARPVTLEEQTYLSWGQVEAVVSGELSPVEAAQQRPGSAWFGIDD